MRWANVSQSFSFNIKFLYALEENIIYFLFFTVQLCFYFPFQQRKTCFEEKFAIISLLFFSPSGDITVLFLFSFENSILDFFTRKPIPLP